MALKAGRRGLHKRLVDAFGNLNGEAPSGEYYTKQQTDNKFETKTHVNNTFQKKTLDVPIEMLSGSKLTVEDALQGLNEEKFTYADNGVLGAKNRLKYSSNIYTKTLSGVTFTLNSDGSLSLSGTATESIFFNLVNPDEIPKSEAQILNGCPKGGSLTTYALRWNKGSENLYDNGDGVAIPANAMLSAIEIRIQSGYNTDGLVFNPMLRLASDPDDTYVPYTMTNRELTENVFAKRTLTSADDLNNVTETGIYGVATAPANSPENKDYYTLIVQKSSNDAIRQIITRKDVIYSRAYSGYPTTWSSWYKFTGTEVV